MQKKNKKNWKTGGLKMLNEREQHTLNLARKYAEEEQKELENRRKENESINENKNYR